MTVRFKLNSQNRGAPRRSGISCSASRWRPPSPSVGCRAHALRDGGWKASRVSMFHSACATADPVPQHGLGHPLHVQCWTAVPPFLEIASCRKGNRKENAMKKKQPDLGRLGRMMDCYVLVNHKPKRASSLKEWMDFLASPDCIVASTDIGRVNVTPPSWGSTSAPPAMDRPCSLRRRSSAALMTGSGITLQHGVGLR